MTCLFAAADGLVVRPVSDYQAIKASLAEGDRNRTIASTKMNETSSRAHTIVTVNFHQSRQNNITTLSALNLVDLAGRSVLIELLAGLVSYQSGE